MADFVRHLLLACALVCVMCAITAKNFFKREWQISRKNWDEGLD
jgi:hypothetical protein